MIRESVRSIFYSCLFVIVATWFSGCTNNLPLSTPDMQQGVHDPQASVLIVHFVSLNPQKYGIHDTRWFFAAANESSGWNLRMLNIHHMIFHTGKDSLEPDMGNIYSGWVTILVPPGPTYLAVANPGYYKNSRFKKTHMMGLDFIDMPRFLLHIEQPQSLIYGGTIVADSDCSDSVKNPVCSNGLSIVDESTLAKEFVAKYLKEFKLASPLHTRLLTAAPSRTIVIPRESTLQR